MDTKYTPGPWMVRSTGCVGTDDMMVASVYPMEDQNLEEHDANARLIAAAPELLEALRSAHHMLTRDYIDPAKMAVVYKCSEAIELATGEDHG